MEEMESKFARRLLLTEDEEEEIVIEEDEDNISPWEEEMERCLIGTLLTNKNYKGEFMKSTMIEAWRVEGKVEIKDIAKNLYMFIFEKRSDKEAVMIRSPWNFDRALLMLKNPERDKNPKDIIFDTIEFWIQIHNLPLRAFQKNVAMKIGERIGRLIKVDETERGLKWGTFMRVRVEIDIRKPLQRGAMISLKGLGKIWAGFKYERLPKVCQWCGILGHADFLCEEKKEEGKGDYGDLYAEKEILRSRVYETKKQNSYSSSSNQYKGSEEKREENDGIKLAISNKVRGRVISEIGDKGEGDGSEIRSGFENDSNGFVISKSSDLVGEKIRHREDELIDTASSPLKEKSIQHINTSHVFRNLNSALGEKKGDDLIVEENDLIDGKVKKLGRKWKSLARQKKTSGGEKVIMGKRTHDPMLIDDEGIDFQNKKVRTGDEGRIVGNEITHVTGGNDGPRYEK